MPPYIVAIDHPSLLSLVGPFVDDLRQESRRFGRVDAANPKPFPSLVRRVTDPAHTRFGVMTEHGLVGMASLSHDGEISMAVAARHRGNGHGTRLLVHVIHVAEQADFGRVLMTSSRRSRPISRLGDRLGWTAVDVAPGRLDLILDLPRRQSAEVAAGSGRRRHSGALPGLPARGTRGAFSGNPQQEKPGNPSRRHPRSTAWNVTLGA